MESPNSLEIGAILIGLVGGLALFLYGMEQMTDAMKTVAGEGMKKLLARLTTNRFKAVFAGALVTSIIQSSSVTTVLVVGFISAGLMTLAQSIGIILGADIGTTVTAQIVAFKVTKYALVLVTIGFLMQFVAKKEKIRQYGIMTLGLGLVFFGMEMMSQATHPLRTYEPFIDLMRKMDNPLVGTLIGTLFTGIIQSSSAMMGVVIVMASQGFISLEAGIALVFGANIGTCVTALLAAIGKPREAVRAAFAHIFFKVVGVVIWFGFIEQLAEIVRWISPAHPELSGAARLAAETPRQVANAHTLFNVANTFLFIWFTGPLARFMRRLIPERPPTGPGAVQPKYLDDILLETPVLALDRVRMELRRIGERALEMVQRALPAAIHGEKEDLEKLAEMDDEVDLLHSAVIQYLGRLSQQNLTESPSRLLNHYISAANNIENIGDLIETNIVGAGMERVRRQVRVSEGARQVLRGLHDRVTWAVQLALEALDASDEHMAERVIQAKGEINRLVEEAERYLAGRLAAEGEDRVTLFRIESELIEYLKRVYYFAKRIAKSVQEVERSEEDATHDVEESALAGA